MFGGKQHKHFKEGNQSDEGPETKFYLGSNSKRRNWLLGALVTRALLALPTKKAAFEHASQDFDFRGFPEPNV